MARCRNANKIAGFVLIGIGALVLIFAIPGWIWAVLIGGALIAVGVALVKC